MPRVLIILASLWLGFSILHEALTGKIWFWVIPGMSPPILFAMIPLVLITMSFVVKRYRKAVIIISIIAFLVSIPSTGLNFSAVYKDVVHKEDGVAFKVVQMNTDYWGQLRDGTLTDPRDKERMLAFLRSLDADIYLLQEHMVRDGNTALPVTDLSDLEEVFPEYEVATAGTLLTLSRLPIVGQTVVHSEAPQILKLPPPPYSLKVDIRIDNTIVSTYNIHMPIQIIIEKNWFSADFYQEIKRRHYIRLKEFQALSKDVAQNPWPLVIAGDFNTSPAMGDNRELLGLTEDAASFSSIIYPATWRVGGQLPKLWRNDWFLVGKGLQVNRFRQLDPEGNSDHLVQTADLLTQRHQGD